MKRTKTNIWDFDFQQKGYGRYEVTYTSPVTGKKWSSEITDMELIDATKNACDPKRCDLEQLKMVCKR